MLSRSGSSASDNLQRSKSASSVKERRKHPLTAESVNPETARAHALIAAHRAVDRSRERTSTSLTRSQSASSQPVLIARQDRSLNTSPASYLRTQRSTLQTRMPKLANTLRVPGAGAEAYGLGRNPNGSIYGVEFGAEGENYGAEPSSYRRLRRSRSSLTPTRRIPRLQGEPSETPFSQARTIRPAASSIALRSPGLKLRLKRSMNFLRPVWGLTTRVATAPAQLQSDASTSQDAIALARNQFLQESGQSSVASHSSFSLSSRAKRAQSTFRKTFRTADKPGEDKVVNKLDGGKSPNRLENESTSTSLTNRIKRVFRATKPDPQLPPQQLDATRAYFKIDLRAKSPEAGFDSYLASGPGLDDQTDPYNHSDLHPTTVDDIEQLSQRLSRSDSRGSLTSESKSRVTSWANSTAVGSVSERPPTNEPKRLSVIREDGGPHQPSSSVGRHIGGVSIFQQPLRIPEGRMVDSQRVYSALMKRIDEEQKEMEQTQAALTEIHVAQEQDDVVGHYLFSSPTIRRVESQNSTLQVETDEKQPVVNSIFLSQTERNKRLDSGSKPERNKDTRNTPKQQPLHSNFHPFCDGKAASITGYFQQLPDERRMNVHEQANLESGAEGAVVNGSHSSTGLGLSRFSESTESIYSRTTNGGTNADYVSPVCSTENFGSRPSFAGSSNSMATVLHSAHPKNGMLERSASFTGSSVETCESEEQALEASMQSQARRFQSSSQRPLAHFRENAQIESDDTEVGNRFPLDKQNVVAAAITKGSETLLSPRSFLTSSNLPAHVSNLKRSPAVLSQFKEVPRYSTPTPSRDESIPKGQSALLSQTNAPSKASAVSIAPPSAKRKLSGLRKISANSVAKILKPRKSQSTLEYERPSLGKENNPGNASDLPPVSTPGRYQIQDEFGDGTGQLRKPQNKTSLWSRQGPSDLSHCVQLDNSPSERLKSSLSARLSRPFNMDVPERNRPFDSTYLGQREAKSENRLSVASNHAHIRQRKSYGNIGLSLFPPKTCSTRTDSADSETTALPTQADTNGATGSLSGQNPRHEGTRVDSSFFENRWRRDDRNARSASGGSTVFI